MIIPLSAESASLVTEEFVASSMKQVSSLESMDDCESIDFEDDVTNFLGSPTNVPKVVINSKVPLTNLWRKDVTPSKFPFQCCAYNTNDCPYFLYSFGSQEMLEKYHSHVTTCDAMEATKIDRWEGRRKSEKIWMVFQKTRVVENEVTFLFYTF